MSTAEAQSAAWGKGARDWSEVQEGMVTPLYQTVLARLGVRPQTKLLDVGCGAGLFCQMAKDMGADVSGIDASNALLNIARNRVPGGDFRVGDMETLPFDGGAFDIVTGFNSFQFAGSPLNALRQARRVLKADGVLAVSIWGSRQQSQAAGVLNALAALLPEPRPANAPGPFALSAPGALEPMVVQAGFEPFRTDEVDCLWVYPDFKTLSRGLLASGPGAAAKEAAGATGVKKVLTAAAEPFKTQSGSYEMRNTFRYLLARPRWRTATR